MWKYTDSTNKYASKIFPDGHGECVPVENLPEGTEILPADPIAQPPIVVSPRQIRQALTALNLRTQVESAVASGDQDLKDWWEFSTSYESNHPEVLDMATSLNISVEQITQLFELARSL